MCRGYSLLELVITTAIVAVVAFSAVVTIGKTGGQNKLQFETERLSMMLEKARSRAWATRKPTGVRIEPGRIAIDDEAGRIVSEQRFHQSVEIAVLRENDGRLVFYPSGAASPATITLASIGRTCRVVVSLRGRIRSTC